MNCIFGVLVLVMLPLKGEGVEINPSGESFWNITSDARTILGDEVGVKIKAGKLCLEKENSQIDVKIEGCDGKVREQLPFKRVACATETDWSVKVYNPSNCTIVVQPVFLWDKRSTETVQPPRVVTVGSPFRTLFNNTGHYLDSTPYMERPDSTATCYEKPLVTNNNHTAEFEWFCTESGLFSFCYISDDIVDYCHRIKVLPKGCSAGYVCMQNCSTLTPQCQPTCQASQCQPGYHNLKNLCVNGNCTHDSCCELDVMEVPGTYEQPRTFFMIVVLVLVFGCCTLLFGVLGVRYWLSGKKKQQQEDVMSNSSSSFYRRKSTGLMRAPLLIEEMQTVMVQSTGELDLSTSSTPTMLSRHLSASVGVYGAVNDSPMSEMLTSNSIKTPIGIVKRVSIYEPNGSPPSALKRLPRNDSIGGTLPRSNTNPIYTTTSPMATPR